MSYSKSYNIYNFYAKCLFHGQISFLIFKIQGQIHIFKNITFSRLFSSFNSVLTTLK